MRLILSLWALALCIRSCCASVLPHSGTPSYNYFTSAEHPLVAEEERVSSGPNVDLSNEERASAVKDAFTFAFNNYWEFCKGQDELLPVTNTCGNPRYLSNAL